MGELEDVAGRFIAVVTAPTVSPEELEQTGNRLFTFASDAAPDELHRASERFVEAMAGVTIGRASFLALACGAFVECGGDPVAVARPIFALASEALAAAVPFVEACMAEAKAHQGSEGRLAGDAASENDDEDRGSEGNSNSATERYGEQIGERMPDNAEAWWAVDRVCRAAVALLCRSKAARLIAHAGGALAPAVQGFPEPNEVVESLTELLRILDDEDLVVLHPELRRGYRVRISGIMSNFDLHTLLEDAVIGDPRDGWLPGTRPHPMAVAVARGTPSDDPPSVSGVFNLVNWTGLLPDGTVSAGYHGNESRHWIWNEGVPADIEPFGGTRVVLLGPPPYPRGWGGGRESPFPRAELGVTAQMTDAEVRDWLFRLIAAVGRDAQAEERGGE